MDTFVYHSIKDAEQADWWYKGLRQIIFSYLKRYSPHISGRLLDIGCGTGYLLKTLEKTWNVYGIDISPTAISIAKKRKLKHILRASVEKLPFNDNIFDAILVLDVIEHVYDDMKALAEVYRVLKPGGIAIFNTPAYQFLWSYHDVSARHIRRYTITDFAQKLQQTHFQIKKLSYINFLLFPLAVLHRLWSKIDPSKQPQTDIGSVPANLQEWFYRIFSCEEILLKWFDLPWGLSISAVVKK